VAPILSHHRSEGVTVRVLLAAVLVVAFVAGCVGADVRPSDRPVRLVAGAAATLDPARAGDASSASVIAQVFETLTAFDQSLTLRPALAESWDIQEDGRRIVFRLRDGLTFSDGSPLTGEDVVRSWLRLIDPEQPSPLVSLILDVEGAVAYLRGEVDASGVGVRADGRDVTVDLVRPAADFVNIIAGPSFAIVPRGIDADPTVLAPGSFVGSGGFVIAAATPGTTTLGANERYWAGPPHVRTVELIHDLGGRSPVAAYEAGDVDYVPIGQFDASWVVYDETLGPDLREVPSMSVQYYGFDTTRPPFDDVRIRRAFGAAVDWRRIVLLGSTGADDVANSMVPPGIPGRSERDFLPVHDPAEARRLLAEAGYPEGRDFPEVTMLTGGGAFDEAVVRELERELGIRVTYETMSFDTYFDRLAADPPAIWSLGWVADYPGPNDFLGVLLGTDSSNNYGGWSSEAFDAAIAEALASGDPVVIRAAFDRAEAVVRDDVPVIPTAYGTGWALSRPELLGADQNGLGTIRMAGLAWAD
jgi:oligopeptide transport system substrate-binding protein